MLKRVRSCTILRSRGKEANLFYGAFNGLKFDQGFGSERKRKDVAIHNKKRKTNAKGWGKLIRMYLTCGSRSSHQTSK
jgi:hypothetical protein